MKINIRKGLFETSSSSEDSLSVYQDMQLFILPKAAYEKFVEGKLYIKLTDMKPPFTADDECKNTANKEAVDKLKQNGSRYNSINSIEDIYTYRWYDFRNIFYINYKQYLDMVKSYFYEVNFFNYENGNQVIFGFYGYTEE